MVAVPVSAIVLGVGAAASFAIGDAVGFLTEAAEGIFVVTWLLGWVLLACAAMVGGGCAVLLGLRWLSRRPVSRSEAAIVGASLALVVAVLATHPLWGTGSAVGG